MTETNIYIPALLKFVDDNISIPLKIQNDIKKSIRLPFSDYTNTDGFNYKMDSKDLLSTIMEFDNDVLKIETVILYYHHRIIFNYKITNNNPLQSKLSSDIRKAVLLHFGNNIETLINQINEGVKKCDFFEDEITLNKTKIISYYSYPIIFQFHNKNIMRKLSEQVETMYFRIFLPSKKGFSYGSEAFIRISIPSFHVFHSEELSTEVISNFINVIYQFVLYKKKTEDFESMQDKVLNRAEKDIPFSKDILLEYNVVDEAVLKEIWQYSTDSMGGKISDAQQSKVSKILFGLNYFSLGIALISLIVAAVSIIIASN